MSNLKQIEQLQDYREQITMTDIFVSGMLAVEDQTGPATRLRLVTGV